MSMVNTVAGPVDATAAAGAGNATTSAKDLNDRFLKLLVAQLNNQDPLNPLDNAQVTSQMAQINTVTGINGLNDTVTQLLAQFSRLETMQAAQLTGRSVLVSGSSLALADGGSATGGVLLNQPADSVTVQIQDANGQTVRTLALGRLDAGPTRFDWDGRTDSGDAALPGTYTFSVTAKAGTTEVGAAPLAAGRVSGVRQGAGGAVQLVLANGSVVSYTDIQQIL